MGRKPRGETKLSNAQKQKLYRERKNPDERKKAEKKRKAKQGKQFIMILNCTKSIRILRMRHKGSTGKEKLKGHQKS